MNILRTIKTDVTPFDRQARMVQQMIHLIMRCGAPNPLMILLELQRAGVVMNEQELKDMMLSMERQGFLKREKLPESNGEQKAETVPINNTNGNDL